jgi:hypothetical protein
MCFPLVEEAAKAYREISPCTPAEIRLDYHVNSDSGGTLRHTDVVKGLALPGGLLLAGGAVGTAIVTTTQLLVLTTVVVNWPLLIAGLVLGGTLAISGGASLATLNRRLQERFQSSLLPLIQNALVGQNIPDQGEHVPSLKEQLQQQVRRQAETFRRYLDDKG